MKRFAFAVLLAIVLVHLGGAAEQVAEPFTLALTGDSIITQRLSAFKEPAFTGLMDMFRGRRRIHQPRDAVS